MVKFLAIFAFATQVWAAPEFNNLRDDLHVPQACRTMDFSFYQLPADYFFVGREGALSMGFTFEYPLKRRDATTLWKYFQTVVHGAPDANLYDKIQRSPALKRDHDIISDFYYEEGFDFGNEGEILEILAIHALYQEFPENTYFISGGAEYYNSGSHTLGEIDVYVGNRSTCEIIAVGETKLGRRKTLNKARKQLSRFEGFLLQNHGPGFGSEYEPQTGRGELAPYTH